MAVFLFSGCGTKMLPTAGGSADSSVRNYDAPITIKNNKASVTVSVHLMVDKDQTETSSSSGQTGATAPTSITTDVSAALAQGGATNSLVEEGGKLLLKGVTSTAKYLNKRMEQVTAAKASIEPVEISSTEIKDPTMITETFKYHGRHNGDRATWYAKNNLKDYPQTFIVEIPGCTKFSVNAHDGNRIEHTGYIIKQSEVAGRGLGLIAPQSCQSKDATISYVVPGKDIASSIIDVRRYDHMSYGSVSAYAGNGLMQCLGDPEYDSCEINGEPMKVNRKNDYGRTHWWPADHKKHPEGSVIICERDGKKYQYVWKNESYPRCKSD